MIDTKPKQVFTKKIVECLLKHFNIQAVRLLLGTMSAVLDSSTLSSLDPVDGAVCATRREIVNVELQKEEKSQPGRITCNVTSSLLSFKLG